jgi:hypothetical protein
MTTTPAASTPETNDAVREAMRTALLAQGFATADIETMLPAQEETYRVRRAVTEAIAAMCRDLPSSVKTWAPYLRLLVDGLPGMCPCPCPNCATGPCPCPGGAGGHAEACAMPDDELHTDCAVRYAGVPHLLVGEVTRGVVADAAW